MKTAVIEKEKLDAITEGIVKALEGARCHGGTIDVLVRWQAVDSRGGHGDHGWKNDMDLVPNITVTISPGKP